MATQTSDTPRTFIANGQTAKAAAGAPAIMIPIASRAPKTPKAPAVRKSIEKTAAPFDPCAPVIRPNGTAYQPRGLANLSDVQALRQLRAAGVPALLYGPPGTGKTSLIEAAFPDLITIAGDGDTAVSDFVGEWAQRPDGTYHFVHGPLITAMREGRVLFVDDATLISPKVLAALYPCMDGRKTITVKAHEGETVTAAEGFYVVAGHNPGVAGAILTEALASRFSAMVEVSSDYDLAEELGVDKKAVRIARNLAGRAAKGEIQWAPQLRELLAFSRIAKVLGTEAAFANLVGIAPETDRASVAEVVESVTGQKAAPLALGARMTPARR